MTLADALTALLAVGPFSLTAGVLAGYYRPHLGRTSRHDR